MYRIYNKQYLFSVKELIKRIYKYFSSSSMSIPSSSNRWILLGLYAVCISSSYGYGWLMRRNPARKYPRVYTDT
jgi:hypothetical protein